MASPTTGAVTPVPTHCPYCSLQCGMTLTPREQGAGPVLEVAGANFPTNRGGLCEKGLSSAELIDHPDRLTTPLVRDHRDAPFREATWDEAYDRIATALTVAQERHGRDAAGLFGGGGLTNEKAYQAGKFVRVALRSASIDYNGRFCMSSAAAAATKAFGIDRGMPFPLADIARADTVMLVGSNPADTMPPAMRWFAAGVERGARHLVVDPRYTATAATADVHLQPVPGTDLALANGLLHLAIKHRLVDTAYVAERTTGWPAVRRAMRQYWPDRVERITGRPGAGHGARGAPARRVAGHDDPLRARRRAAREGLGHGSGLDQPGARARPARPPVLRVGDDDGPGQRPGRARARPEGRPAARLPDARRPRRPRARRRRLGDRPRRAPAARGLRLRDARPPRHPGRRAGAAGHGVEHRGLGAAGRPRAGTARRTRLPVRLATCSSARPPSSPTSSCPAPSGPRRRAR